MKHPTEESLKRFAAGTASREEVRSITAHLLGNCQSCAATICAQVEPRVPAGGYEDVLDRFSALLPWQTSATG